MFKPIGIPIGWYSRTKDYVNEWFVGQGRGIQYLPFNLGAGSSEDFVALIPGGRVWGEAGSVITPNNKILWDVSREWDPSPGSHSIFKQEAVPAVCRTSETVAVLSKIGSKNYYHWMFDVLPRVHLVRLTGIPIDKYIVPHPLAPYQLESLQAMEIPREKLMEAGLGFHLQSARLVVPSLPLEAKWACEFTRNELLQYAKTMPVRGKERLYISRRYCIGRTVVNEAELTRALLVRGFREIIPESMSVAEQIRAFSQAQIVVGPQGAGFINALFCAPQAHVIELMSPSFFITSTEKICLYLNIHYHRIMGRAVHNPKYEHSENYWCGLDNILVNTEDVINTVDRALSL